MINKFQNEQGFIEKNEPLDEYSQFCSEWGKLMSQGRFKEAVQLREWYNFTHQKWIPKHLREG